jgi:hypothetical protein
MKQGVRFFSCSDRIRSVSFHFPFFLNQLWIASRLVCSLCEEMDGSLSVASTAVSSAKVDVIDFGDVGKSAVYSKCNDGQSLGGNVCYGNRSLR